MKKKKPNADQWEGQVYNAKDGQFYSSTIKPVDQDHLQIQGCVLGFLCGGETWTRVAGPIPSSPANSMAKAPAKCRRAAAENGRFERRRSDHALRPLLRRRLQLRAAAPNPTGPTGSVTTGSKS